MMDYLVSAWHELLEDWAYSFLNLNLMMQLVILKVFQTN